MTPEEEVAAAADARWAALIAGDVSALVELLHPDLRHVHGYGGVDTRSDFAERIASGAVRYLAAEWADTSVTVLGDAAWISGRLRLTLANAAQAQDSRYLSVWAKGDGRWRLMAYQVTRISD